MMQSDATQGKLIVHANCDRRQKLQLVVKQPKSRSEKQYLEILGKEELEVNPQDLPKEEGQLGAFGEGTSKRENNEKIRK